LFSARNLKLAAAATAAAAVVAVAVAAPMLGKPRATDQAMCPIDGAITAHTIILVDTTDTFDAGQIAVLRSAADAAVRHLPKGGRLTLMLVDPDKPWQPREAISLCNPGDGAGANPLVETPSVERAEWRRKFSDRIEQEAQALASQPPAERSPLLESATAVLGRRDFGADTPNRALIYVTDGIENMPGGYSQYGLHEFQQAYLRSPLASQIDADFTGVDVELDYLRRPSAGALQGTAHKAFWRWFFKQHHAKEVVIEGA
jgi:hypothetical protein